MYSGIICKIVTHPHPNADKIKLGIAYGHQVVVGLDTQDNTLGVFFPCDGELSHEMCEANKLYRKDGGYFEDNRRVRAQPFRGEKSEGFWMPIEALAWTGIELSDLKDGDLISSLNGKLVCQKYYTKATKEKASGGANKNKTKKIEKCTTQMFHEHFDTSQFRYNSGKIPVGAVVYVTEKLHGTSGRTGNVLVSHPVTGWRSKVNRLLGRDVFKRTEKWEIVSGSRRVAYMPNQAKESETGFYANASFRFMINNEIKQKGLKKGETLYYEIVGWTDTHALIMGSHTIKDKEMKKKYGECIQYTYGQKKNTWGIYVYRITQTNEDGDSIDLSWPAIVARCKELDIKHVPLMDVFVHDGDTESLVEKIKEMSDGDSVLDSTHFREGVCLKIEHPEMLQTLKNKGYWFSLMEGLIKDDENYVDMEEIS